MSNLPDDKDLDLYVEALAALNRADIRYMLGGAFAVYHYTNWWRNTHDVDVYMTLDDVDRAKRALESAGFHDLGEQALGDKEWIYHAAGNDVIVDVIWRFANLANYVTLDWFDRAPHGRLFGMDLLFLPLEELVWLKTFVINRHRCDWPDVMRVIKAQCTSLNWDRLIDMFSEHWLLLAGLVDVLDWQYPDSVACVPEHIRRQLTERRKAYYADPPRGVEREHLLDPWIHQRADNHANRRDE